MSQINLQHGTTTNSGETGKLESKNGYAQKSGESVESVQEKKWWVMVGRICRKGKF